MISLDGKESGGVKLCAYRPKVTAVYSDVMPDRHKSEPVLPPEGAWCWAVTGEVTVGNVAAHHNELLAAVQGRQSILVDLSECTYMDACALQLLVGAQKAARSAGLGFRCEKVSPEVRQDARDLGLEFIVGAGQTEGEEGEMTHG
jgi:anti-anti-sigma factor